MVEGLTPEQITAVGSAVAAVLAVIVGVAVRTARVSEKPKDKADLILEIARRIHSDNAQLHSEREAEAERQIDMLTRIEDRTRRGR